MARPSFHFGGERLQALVAMIPYGSRVADIGCDHCLLSRLLLESGHAAHCIATEVSPAAMAALKDRIQDRPLPANLELRIGDGLDPLLPADRLDLLVLAGIGAATQIRILDSPRLESLGIQRIVLQPQGEPAVLREWLTCNRFRIVQESLIEERGAMHLSLAAETGHDLILEPHPTLSPQDLMAVGPCLALSGSENVRQYWEWQANRLKKVAESAPPSPGREQAVHDLEQAFRILAALPDPAP
jgi:tRNA (adenine22-N1)-methyltransferase